MPIVRVTVELALEVPEDLGEVNPLELEHAARAEGQRAARELYAQVLGSVEGLALASSAGRKRKEPRWIATCFGRMRIWRYRVAEPDRPHPLDAAMGLRQAEATVGLREAVCDLALRLPYRQSAEVIGAPHRPGDLPSELLGDAAGRRGPGSKRRGRAGRDDLRGWRGTTGARGALRLRRA